MGLFPVGTLFAVIYQSGSLISRKIINNSIILSFLKNLVQPINTLHTEVLVGEFNIFWSYYEFTSGRKGTQVPYLLKKKKKLSYKILTWEKEQTD